MGNAKYVDENANVLADLLDPPVQVLVILFIQIHTNFLFSVLLDVTEIPKSDTTVPSNVNMSSYEMSSIAAGVLGGILFFLIIGLVIFIIWKIRKNRKKKLSAQSTSTSSNRYVITPPLYNISISRENSIPLTDPPVTDHIYEELP
jgi:hypothetical protein